MRRRILLDSLLLAIVPMAAVYLTLTFRADVSARTLFAVLGVMLQIPLIYTCRLDMRRFFAPSLEALDHLHISSIPAPYQPGKFKVDTAVTNMGMWMSMAAAPMVFIAMLFPTTTTVSGLEFASYTTPNLTLLILSFVSIILSCLSFALWVKFKQANQIFDQGSERKRYLYRGFAEVIDDAGFCRSYLKVLSDRRKIELQFH